MIKPLSCALALLVSFVLGIAVARYHVPPYDAIDGWLRGKSDTTVNNDGPPGIWNPMPENGTDARGPGKLGATGYAGGYEEATDEEVVPIHRPGAHAGLNLVVSGHAPEAFLVDMNGKPLHSWRCELTAVWRGFTDFQAGYDAFWRRAYVYPDGDLLAIFDGIGIFRLSRDSKHVIWEHKDGEHHDIFVDEDGTIYTLSRREIGEHERLKLEGPIKEDFISILSPQGELLRRISILSSLLDSDYASILDGARRKGDILHTNTIEVMDGRFADRHPLFARGNILISLRDVHTVCVVDPQTERVVWALGGLWRMQHQPTLLDGGNFLVFDNLGYKGKSRVIEIDPLTQEIAWSYSGTAERPLFSNFLGSCQRLPNGSTLICESTRGRALEVTPAGEIMWEYFNPKRAGEKNELIASLFELVRIEDEYFDEDFKQTWRR
jgi:hypothetical protein